MAASTGFAAILRDALRSPRRPQCPQDEGGVFSHKRVTLYAVLAFCDTCALRV
jgi:hypothetical protein